LLAAGALTLSGAVEGLLAVTVFRYRRAADSWLAEEVRRLAPGRRYQVYVAPGTSGVFALGGHTVGIGEHSVGAGGPTPALQRAAAAAVNDLLGGRTRPELAMGRWAFPWFLAKLTAAAFLPRRIHAVARVAAVCWCTAATVVSAGRGLLGAAILCLRGYRSAPDRTHPPATACRERPAGPAAVAGLGRADARPCRLGLGGSLGGSRRGCCES